MTRAAGRQVGNGSIGGHGDSAAVPEETAGAAFGWFGDCRGLSVEVEPIIAELSVES